MLRLAGVVLFSVPILFGQGACTDQLQLAPDYSFAIGSSNGGGSYAFSLGGQTLTQGPLTQLALFHYDGSLGSSAGMAPLQSAGTSFVSGKWGTALAIATGGILSYPASGSIGFAEGTIELWIAPTKDGADPIYSKYDHTLFRYTALNGDLLVLAESASNGSFYAGTASSQAFTGTGGGQIAALKAGQWHHVAFTYSKTQQRLRFYFDGALIYEHDVAPVVPASSGTSFTVDSDPYGNASAFLVDDLRISSNEETAAQIQYDATRSTPLAGNEVLLPLAGVPPGPLSYAVSGCGAAGYAWSGVPVTNLNPPSNLLPPGSTSFVLSFNTLQPASCAYSTGTMLPFASMQAIAAGQGTTSHQGTISGLSADPLVLNTVYLKCDSNPDFVQTLQYRAVASRSGPFPRIGNIWIGDYLLNASPANAAKTQIFFGPGGMTAAQASALRAQDPNVLILPSVNAQEQTGGSPAVPNSYLLKDVNGNTIEDWPGNFLLNLTKPEVAAFLAQFAYQQYFAGANLAFDGLFWDNFHTSIPNIFYDYLGVAHMVDANGDGLPDDQATLTAAWSQGMYSLIRSFDALAPSAYAAGHIGQVPPSPSVLQDFNGDSYTFNALQVREGSFSFDTLLSNYNDWFTSGRPPAIATIQSSPPSQIAYGYGYQPLQNMLPETVQFAQTYYPNMRFGLALALMNDGFSIFDFGDIGAQVNWWYDEYDFNLGFALRPAAQIGGSGGASLLANGGFESGLSSWLLGVSHDGQAIATVAADTSVYADGAASAAIHIASPGTMQFHIELEQGGISLTAATSYHLRFWARSDSPRSITVFSQGGAPNFTNYGLSQQVSLTSAWQSFSLSFTAPLTAQDGRIEFWVGDQAGNVWLDDVALVPSGVDIYRRDYTNGTVLLNGTSSSQTIPIESGFQKFSGSQAPLWQYIVDDAAPAFSADSSWQTVPYDSGLTDYTGYSVAPPNPNPPYYHAWSGGVHQQAAAGTTAQWNLNLPSAGLYTIQVWLPAALGASGWTRTAVYEVVSNGVVMATSMLDQTTAVAGDAWHTVATVSLSPSGAPFLRVHNGGAGILIADAVYITSAALYNDGGPVSQVTLAPLDGILLKRLQPATVPPPPVLTIAEAHGGSFTQGQSNAVSTITVSNQAGAGSTNGAVSVTETVPAGLTLISLTGPGWLCPVPGKSCARSDVLVSGQSYPPITVTMTVSATAPSSVTNMATVSGGGSGSATAMDVTNIAVSGGGHPAFFAGESAVSGSIDYLQFPGGNLFGYYGYLSSSILYHVDMGYEAFLASGGGAIYFYDFASGHWLYSSSSLFPYLYDFSLSSWIYYFPDTKSSGHYTANPRSFVNLTTQKIFTM